MKKSKKKFNFNRNIELKYLYLKQMVNFHIRANISDGQNKYKKLQINDLLDFRLRINSRSRAIPSNPITFKYKTYKNEESSINF